MIKEFPFTDEEVKYLLSTIRHQDSRFNPVWKRAFDYHNTRSEKPLSMGCFPCYLKVYQFVKQTHQKI